MFKKSIIWFLFRVQKPQDVSEVFGQLTTIQMNRNEPIEFMVKNYELLESEQPKCSSELPTERISSRIELPRITDHRTSELLNDSHQDFQIQLTSKNNKQREVSHKLVCFILFLFNYTTA